MIITYTVVRGALNPARLDTEQTISLKPSKFRRLKSDEDSKTTLSKDKSVHRTTYIGTEYTTDIEFKQITESQLDHVQEFIKSAVTGITIEIDPEGYPGHPGIYNNVLLVSKNHSESRVGHRLYGLKISVQIFDT